MCDSLYVHNDCNCMKMSKIYYFNKVSCEYYLEEPVYVGMLYEYV